VAFELWHPFSTGMERVKMLQGLRESGTFPKNWEAQNPQVRLLLTYTMTRPHPSDRVIFIQHSTEASDSGVPASRLDQKF
jgi:hypothetical protein